MTTSPTTPGAAVPRAGVHRVTVVGSVRRLDLAVPGSAPIAELLPELVALAGEPVDTAALTRWVLSRLDGGDLPADATLASAGVADGAVLYLRRVDEPVVGLHGVDLVRRAAGDSDDGLPPAVDRMVLAAGAAALLVVVGALLLRESPRPGAVAAGVLAVLAIAAGRRLHGSALPGTTGGATLLALSAVPLASVAAALVGSALSQERRLGVGLAGAALGALLVAAALRPARAPAGAAAALTAIGAASALLAIPLDAGRTAAITAVLALLTVPLLPRLVLRLHGLQLSHPERAGTASTQQLTAARSSLPWALAAAGVTVLLACLVLARTARGAELPLAALCGLLLILRSRERRGAAEALPLAVPGHGSVIAAGVGLVLSQARTAAALIVLVASGAVYAVAAGLPPQLVDRPRWARRRRLLEGAALVAVVPLLAAVLGVFGAVVDLARGAE